MAYRTCADCNWNRIGECGMGRHYTYENEYDKNQCDLGTGKIYFDDDDEED